MKIKRKRKTIKKNLTNSSLVTDTDIREIPLYEISEDQKIV